MSHPALHVCYGLSCVALIPAPIELLGYPPELTMRFPERSSGTISPRFSSQRRRRAASSLPIITRASEPPMKVRRSTHFPDLASLLDIVLPSGAQLLAIEAESGNELIEVLLIQFSPPVNRNSINWRAKLITTRQVKAARVLLGWTQADLANRSGISEPTVARLESIDGRLGGRAGTADKIRAALETAGIEFIDENGGGPGVRLRKRQPKKR